MARRRTSSNSKLNQVIDRCKQQGKSIHMMRPRRGKSRKSVASLATLQRRCPVGRKMSPRRRRSSRKRMSNKTKMQKIISQCHDMGMSTQMLRSRDGVPSGSLASLATLQRRCSPMGSKKYPQARLSKLRRNSKRGSTPHGSLRRTSGKRYSVPPTPRFSDKSFNLSRRSSRRSSRHSSRRSIPSRIQTPRGSYSRHSSGKKRSSGGKRSSDGKKHSSGGKRSSDGKKRSSGGKRSSDGKKRSSGGKRFSDGKKHSSGGKRSSNGKKRSSGGKRSSDGKKRSSGGKKRSSGGKRSSDGKKNRASPQKPSSRRFFFQKRTTQQPSERKNVPWDMLTTEEQMRDFYKLQNMARQRQASLKN